MKWLMDLLGQTAVNGYDGLSIPMPQRTPENVDEAGSTIKYALGRLEDRHQAALAALVQKEKLSGTASLDLTALPDIYAPIKRFTQYLLPHLEFATIDLSNQDNVRCLWTRRSVGEHVQLDIDQLSSGEKSLITLFLPLLETEISTLLNTIDTVPGPTRESDVLMLIDEPEQHLHPDLQARVMTYLRTIAREAHTLFIVSTHSPTILDHAFDDELYVMVAPGTDPNDNQLHRVATNLERLEALRQLTGNTFVATTGRSVICIEGESSDVTEPSDIALLELMFPRATAYTFVPVGNKSSVINTVTRLRESLPVDAFKIHIFGITDRDLGPIQGDGIVSWPVCMIENFLCEPRLIAETASLLSPGTPRAEADVEAMLSEVITALVDEEIGLRVSKRIKARTVRARGTSTDEVLASINKQIAPFDALRTDRAGLQGHVNAARAEVEGIVAQGTGLQHFRGKQVLTNIYSRLWPTGQVGYSTFVVELAKGAASIERITRSIDDVFTRLEASAISPNRPPQ
jgi:hypothetical protein